ncbi:MAG: alkaline phosphatase family protein [Candidatus Cybelea sp.]
MLATVAALILHSSTLLHAQGAARSVLPNGWALQAPAGAMVATGTMPQGAARSPDGSMIAVVESGFNPPALSIYTTLGLRLAKRYNLAGAYGRPVWAQRGIFVAGANADALFAIDPHLQTVRKIALPPKSYPVSVAENRGVFAVAFNGDGAVRIGKLDALRGARPIAVGFRPRNLAFSTDGKMLFVAVRSGSYVAAVDVATLRVHHITTDLHPSDVLVSGNTIYVSQADADTVGAYDAQTGKRRSDVFVGSVAHTIGSSPNALALEGDRLFVSLGAANEVVVLRSGRIAARLPAGWYPTDIVPLGNDLFVINGKGEGTKPNPAFDVMSRSNRDYIAAIQFGSIREISTSAALPPSPQGAQGATPRPSSTILHAGGPIRHVFFILKENRTYDQILGDMPEGNGDPKLVWFGARVTPNQHALSQRFGLFDDFYASGEVSDAGHNWADGAFANDYVERTWPPVYGGRLADDDVLTGIGAGVPSGGYMWDAARRAGVSFRDYGEMALMPAIEGHIAATAPSLGTRFDPHYVGWNLDYSDLDRVKEWKHEFDGFVAADTLPQLEYMWLPNDHTAGTRSGKLTPASYIATNDYAVGQIVDAISHSRVWASSAVFITEDDAQDGADHVSDQRTTLYIASPYARGGVIHEHFATVSVLRTIELLLGLRPLSNYDATAAPLYAAFTTTAHLAPFEAIAPKVDLTTRNSKVAYGAALSARLDFRRPDAIAPGILTDILAHNH